MGRDEFLRCFVKKKSAERREFSLGRGPGLGIKGARSTEIDPEQVRSFFLSFTAFWLLETALLDSRNAPLPLEGTASARDDETDLLSSRRGPSPRAARRHGIRWRWCPNAVCSTSYEPLPEVAFEPYHEASFERFLAYELLLWPALWLTASSLSSFPLASKQITTEIP